MQQVSVFSCFLLPCYTKVHVSFLLSVPNPSRYSAWFILCSDDELSATRSHLGFVLGLYILGTHLFPAVQHPPDPPRWLQRSPAGRLIHTGGRAITRMDGRTGRREVGGSDGVDWRKNGHRDGWQVGRTSRFCDRWGMSRERKELRKWEQKMIP